MRAFFQKTVQSCCVDVRFKLRNRVRRLISFEKLEARLQFYTTAPNGLPLLDSLPGSASAIYLDLDGGAYQGGGTYQGFDTDGDPSTYNAAEQSRIYDTWYRVSMYYSMFNVNVSTDPNVAGDRAWVLIGNDISGGLGFVNSFPDNSVAASKVASSFAPGRSTGIVHEAGHNFGNNHTSKYDGYGDKTAEYIGAFDPLHGALMGIDYAGIVQKFSHWVNKNGPTSIQDEMEVIRNDLNNSDGATSDGYRVDDDPDGSLSTPIALTIGTAKTGVIERLTDVDVYSFTITTAGNYTISALRDFPSPVDLKIEVYNNSGQLLSAEDGDPRKAIANSFDEVMVNDIHHGWSMATGTYKIKVMSHGNYGDQGQYIVRVDPLSNVANPAGSGPTRWQNEDVGLNGVGGYANYNSTSGNWTISASGTNIWGKGDGMHYVYQPLTGDGSITVKVNSIVDTRGDGFSLAGVMIRETLSEGSKNVSLLTSPGQGDQFSWRSTFGANSSGVTPNLNTPLTAHFLRLTRVGNNFTAEISATGLAGSWTQVGTTQTVAMNSKVLIGLAVSSVENEAPTTAVLSNLALTGLINEQINTTGAPSNPTTTLGTVTSNSIALSWTNVSGESGYSIMRSDDGTQQNLVEVGSVAANVTTFVDNTVTDAQHYWYRVRSKGTGAIVSTGSNWVDTTTRAGAVSDFIIQSIDTSTLVLNWTDASGETGYRVERSANGTSGWTSLGTIGQNRRVFVDSTLATANTQFFYRVVTTDAIGDAATSVVASNYTRLPSVTGLIVTGRTATSVSLSWSALAGVTGYDVVRYDEELDDYVAIATNQSGTTITDSTASPLREYQYLVTGVNANTKSATDTTTLVSTPDTAALPSPWASQDVGAVGGPGAAGFDSNGTFTVIGSGTDIWGSADEMHFVSVPMTGNGFIQVRINTIEEDGTNTFGGIMMRDGTAAGAKNITVLSLNNSDLRRQSRSSTNGSTSWLAGPTGAESYYLRITRTGNSFLPQTSPDGITWTNLGSAVSITMSSTIRIGLVVASLDNSRLDKVTFDHVDSTPTGFMGNGGSLLRSGGNNFASRGLGAAFTSANSAQREPGFVSYRSRHEVVSSNTLTTSRSATASSQSYWVELAQESEQHRPRRDSNSIIDLLVNSALDSVGPRKGKNKEFIFSATEEL